MGKEYIEREALLNDIQNFITQNKDIEGSLAYYTFMAMIDEIKNIPAADVAPVRHGEWEVHTEYAIFGLYQVGWRCSLCGRKESYKQPYCNCGAKMNRGK